MPDNDIPQNAAEASIRVLIVDDSSEAREYIALLLSYEEDIQVVGFASDGAEAIERAKELSPHVTLIGIDLPHMEGLVATQRLSLEAPLVKVIIIGQPDPDQMRRALDAGALDFVAKPIDPDELIAAI